LVQHGDVHSWILLVEIYRHWFNYRNPCRIGNDCYNYRRKRKAMTTEMHDSTTCNCEMCRFANSTPQESRGVSDAVSESKSVFSGDSEAVAGQCRERGDGSNEQETEQLIARIHAAMAEDCDCPQHQTGDAEIDFAVLERISTAISRDQTFASLTTVRAAIYDVIDKGSFSGWWALYDEGDNPEVTEDMINQERCDFVDAVCARILALQREPHGMDAGLRGDALDNQEFYELMQAYRHAGIADQDAAVAAFEAVKSFVRARNVSETVSPAAAIRRDFEAREGEQLREADAELAEVREVLEGIRGFYGTADCWCDSEDDAPHFEHCQRARALYERLRVK
jgi:hypothetical protein